MIKNRKWIGWFLGFLIFSRISAFGGIRRRRDLRNPALAGNF